MDVEFFDFELNKIKILPLSSKSDGIVSVTGKIEFCGNGSFQLSFISDELINLIRQHKEGLIVKYGPFEGFTTDYSFSREKKVVYGMQLNGLLHKRVIQPDTFRGNLDTIMSDIFSSYYEYITYQGINTSLTVDYEVKDLKSGENVIYDILKSVNGGIELYLDLTNNEICCKIKLIRDNNLMLPDENLNAYDFQEDFNGKTVAYGGWYKHKNSQDIDVYDYVSRETKTGIYRQDVVLTGETLQEARQELEKHLEEFNITAKTKNIKYLEDYFLGDKVRVRSSFGDVAEKYVDSVEIWAEGNVENEVPTFKNIT